MAIAQACMRGQRVGIGELRPRIYEREGMYTQGLQKTCKMFNLVRDPRGRTGMYIGHTYCAIGGEEP